MAKYMDVPVTKAYTCDVTQYGYLDQPKNKLRVPMHYVLKNDKSNNLGTAPLQPGKVRLFRHNAHEGLCFVTAQSIKYVPIGDKIELNLGPDPEVIFEWIKQRAWRTDVWMLLDGTDVYRQVDNGAIQIEVNSSIAGWNEHTHFTQRIRNYTTKPIHVEVRRTLPGHITFRHALDATLHDFQTVEYQAEVAAGTKTDLNCEVVQHCGHNEKQNNVTLAPLGE